MHKHSSVKREDSDCNRFVIFLPAATKLGQGNIFTPVCDSVNRWGGVWSGPGGGWSARGGRGWWSAWGGLQFSGGRGLIQIFLIQIFFLIQFFFLIFFPQNFFWDAPPPLIRSLSGRYASYWNAFLCVKIFI